MGMTGLVVLIFAGVFAVAALLLYASGSGSAEKAKQVQATLDSALATESAEMREQIVNLRKNDQLSAIPWINIARPVVRFSTIWKGKKGR